MKTLHVSILVSLVSSLGVLSAQSAVNWSPQERTLSVLKTSQVRVKLPPLPSGAEWILGVEVGIPSRGQSVIGSIITFRRAARAIPLRGPASITDISPEHLVISGQSITLTPTVAPDACLLLYLRLPAGTTLAVREDSGRTTSFSVTSGLIVHNGLIKQRFLDGRHELLASAMQPSSIPLESEGITSTARGHVAGIKTARSHLLAGSDPDLGWATAMTNVGDMFVVRVTVAADGTVSDVKATRGAVAAAALVSPAIRRWRFTPFELNGQPLEVSFLLPIAKGPDGQLKSALHADRPSQ